VSAAPSIAIPEMDGEVAYPRKNGEPVFDAPWQSRAFGMVVGLHTAGHYPWNDFKALLIDEISAGECAAAPAGTPEYYYQWVEAFERLLAAKGLVGEIEIAERAEQFRTGIRQEVY
jgi:nitrile hydratase accessory protein